MPTTIIEKFIRQEEYESGDLYYPTIKACHDWFDVLNKHIFKSTQKRFQKIQLVNFKDTWAQCEGKYSPKKESRYCNLKIKKSPFPNFASFLVTLAHEMVHNHEWVHENTMTHGKTFLEWKEDFARVGLPLGKHTVRYRKIKN